MSITCYLHNDADLRRMAQSDSLDAAMKRAIFARLHEAFPDPQEFYAVVFHSDPAQQRAVPTPDLVILSEHGIGVVNVCHETGSIFRSEDVWYADGKLVQGNLGLGARNPHEQVQLCAEHLRHHLMTPPRDGAPWLAGRYLTWQDLMFDTAVCFTDPNAAFQHVEHGEQTNAWERFAAFELQGLPHWISRLAFDENPDQRGSVQSYRLPKRHIDRILHELLGVTELAELPKPQFPPTRSYGYLLLKDHDALAARFVLDHEAMTIGREPTCDVMLPRHYRMVSRVHGKLLCAGDGVTIRDTSRNGIFIDGQRIRQSARLSPGQQILLGGSCASDGVCHLEFATEPTLDN